MCKLGSIKDLSHRLISLSDQNRNRERDWYHLTVFVIKLMEKLSSLLSLIPRFVSCTLLTCHDSE